MTEILHNATGERTTNTSQRNSAGLVHVAYIVMVAMKSLNRVVYVLKKNPPPNRSVNSGLDLG